MDDLVLFLYQNLLYLLVFAAILVLAKFAAGFVFFKGNVVDTIMKFFWFYSFSNIHTTETSRHRLLKRMNNLLNFTIYLLVFIYIIVYFIHPEQEMN